MFLAAAAEVSEAVTVGETVVIVVTAVASLAAVLVPIALAYMNKRSPTTTVTNSATLVGMATKLANELSGQIIDLKHRQDRMESELEQYRWVIQSAATVANRLYVRLPNDGDVRDLHDLLSPYRHGTPPAPPPTGPVHHRPPTPGWVQQVQLTQESESED